MVGRFIKIRKTDQTWWFFEEGKRGPIWFSFDKEKLFTLIHLLLTEISVLVRC